MTYTMRQNTTHGIAPQTGLAKLSLLLLVVLLMVLVAGAAAGGTYFYTTRAPAAPEAAKAKPPPAKPTFVKLEPFTINLADDSGRVLYIGLSLKVADDAAAERIKARMPQVRNRVLMTLTDQDAATLTTNAGKKALALALRDEVRKPYTEHGQSLAVSDVLFTDFIVQ